MAQEKDFYWERHAEAEKVCIALLNDCKQENTSLARFEVKLTQLTSSRLLDWVDHFALRGSQQLRGKLSEVGFVRQTDTNLEAFLHPGALLPRIVLDGPSPSPGKCVVMRVESIADFLQANGFRAELEGGPLSSYRRALAFVEGGTGFMVVERRGTGDYEPVDTQESHIRTYLGAMEAWQTRLRSDSDEDRVLEESFRIADNLISQLGQSVAAHVVCLAERNYWLSRNFAARTQQSRQNALGLGWGNQDHYTFRSSRRNFSRLVALFTRLGFRNRERFYAGAEAGWGAQVMEHPVAGLSLFLDVDLAPNEVATDFSREELKPLDRLNTVGLWCALHGDSILQAGMHHFAAQFRFERLIEDLARHGVPYMAPFSDFPYLKQAFSVAEPWDIDAARVAALVKDKSITEEQGERFLTHGAVGSHLENIQRREGYKGFNKKNVSAIIRDTDPRRQTA